MKGFFLSENKYFFKELELCQKLASNQEKRIHINVAISLHF